jgi:CubicO group peptidase (beta-lactamase class C family)
MRKYKWKCKNLQRIVFALFLMVAAGLSGYWIYGSYKLNRLSQMSFHDMVAYTTKGNKDAVITVGIISKDAMSYKVYGENGIELPLEEHVYEIGSITKTFTTSLLCKAISEGKVSLEDSIADYLSLPEKGYYPTIQRLATHTSGYKGYYFEKPMIFNFLQSENGFYGISEEMLISRIGKIRLIDADYPFNYSNFGMAVLGAVLEQIYHEDYTKLMNHYVSDDLGLADTRISDGSGKNKIWKWSESDAYLPAGALLSDITDMMQYASMQINGNPEYLAVAHEALVEVDASSASYEKMGINIDSMGVGWVIDKKNNIIWHNGGTSNYNSYLGFNKEKRIGVVILSNLPPRYRIPATVIGTELLTSLMNQDTPS